MSPALELSIIIVNYKTPNLTTRCIESIYATTRCSFEIIVVDNASGDDSKERICAAFPKVIWVQNKVNEGFGRANNLGVQYAKGKYILLLNSDMVVQKNTIDFCLEQIKKDNSIAAYTCKLTNADGTNQRNAYYDIVSIRKILNNSILFVKIFGEIKSKPNEGVKAIMGAFMLIPKAAFDDVHGFDPDFFMYSEELDLCRRLSSMGYTFGCTDSVYAVHKHEGSSSDKLKTYRQRLLSESLLVYKMRGCLFYVLYHFVSFMAIVTNLIIAVFVHKYMPTAKLANKAYFKNLGQYFTIPCLYKRSIGDGRLLLKIK